MLKTASRLDGIAEYYFATKLREIARMRSEGKDVINLGIGSPDMAPSEEVVARLSESAAKAISHGYQSYTGIPVLRQAWADFYQTHYKATLSPEGEILPLIGSKEGIVHIAMTFLEAGDEALVPNPGYPAYRAATLLAGAKVRPYDLLPQNGWLPDFESLELQDLSRVKILWLNYPHMPTGAPGSEAVFEQALAFGQKHNILIVNDNPYSFILNDSPRSILALPGAKDWALELNSLSKSHNMAGWRVGMLGGHAENVSAVLRFKSNMDSGMFLPVQEAAVSALRQPQGWFTGLNATYRRRQRLAMSLLDLLGCEFEPMQQGLFVWAKIPAAFADGYALSDKVLHEALVFLTPGGIFGSNGEGYVRVSLCAAEGVFEEAIRRCEKTFSGALETSVLPLSSIQG